MIQEEGEASDVEAELAQHSNSFSNGFSFTFSKKKTSSKNKVKKQIKEYFSDDVFPLQDVRPDDQELEFRRFIKYVAQCMDGLPVYDYQNDNHRLAVLGAKKAGVPYKMEPVVTELYNLQEERKLDDLSDDDFQNSSDTFHKFSIEDRFTNMIKPKISAPTFIPQSATSSNLNGLNKMENKVRKHRSDPSLDNFNEFDDGKMGKNEDDVTHKISIVSNTLETTRKVSCKTQRSTDSVSSMLNSLLHWRRKVVDLAAVVPLKRRKKKSNVVVPEITQEILQKMCEENSSDTSNVTNEEENIESQLSGLKLPEFVKVFEDYIHPTVEENIQEMIKQEKAFSTKRHSFLPDAEPDLSPYAEESEDDPEEEVEHEEEAKAVVIVDKLTLKQKIFKILNKPKKLLKPLRKGESGV
ncbi:unnamed protein product [Bursaphelenchus okinawaensis]|uniref:Uncharacterized protein n=1 Tax=Bursaphelenchus okinawaensis TaxID=465554 RepID=A0A811LMW7_9BILA|nr:unnamed protein product [Bursaphelenchus okinawaensis]CAG9124573.1 unnamed protein product [Bursaphelenchus okinawaensis]